MASILLIVMMVAGIVVLRRLQRSVEDQETALRLEQHLGERWAAFLAEKWSNE